MDASGKSSLLMRPRSSARGYSRRLRLHAGGVPDERAPCLSVVLKHDMGHFVICAGVHYDDIPKEWIPEILSAGRTLGQRAVSYLRERLAEQG